jgi:hypothetical protein
MAGKDNLRLVNFSGGLAEAGDSALAALALARVIGEEITYNAIMALSPEALVALKTSLTREWATGLTAKDKADYVRVLVRDYEAAQTPEGRTAVFRAYDSIVLRVAANRVETQHMPVEDRIKYTRSLVAELEIGTVITETLEARIYNLRQQHVGGPLQTPDVSDGARIIRKRDDGSVEIRELSQDSG